MQEYVVLTNEQFRTLCDKDNISNNKESINKITQEVESLSNLNAINTEPKFNKIEEETRDLIADQPDPPTDLPAPAPSESRAPGSEDEEKRVAELEKKALPLYDFLKKRSPSLDWNRNYEILLSGSLLPD